jgi:hypothetical protein
MNSNAKVPFKFVTTFNASSSGFTLSSLDLQLPNMGGRLAAMAALFKKWRLTHLRVKGITDGIPTVAISAGAAGISFASGYYGSPLSNVTATPSTLAEIMTFMYSDLGHSTLRYSVPRSTLHEASNSEWLPTSNAGSVPNIDLSAGCIFSGMQIGQTLATGSVRIYIIYSGIAEFCEPTTPSVTLTEGGIGITQEDRALTAVSAAHCDDEDDEKRSSASWDAVGDVPELSKVDRVVLSKLLKRAMPPPSAAAGTPSGPRSVVQKDPF